jgi:hypothetical protein
MAARNCLLPLPNLQSEIHHEPLGQVQSHRLIAAEESDDAGPLHASCTLQLVVRNSAFNDRTFEQVGYRSFSLTSTHGADYHSMNLPDQWPVRLITPSEVVPAPDVVAWLRNHPQIQVLNVAGNRESKNPGIGERVERFLIAVFKRLKE